MGIVRLGGLAGRLGGMASSLAVAQARGRGIVPGAANGGGTLAYATDMAALEVRAMSGSYAPTNGMDTIAEITTGGWETDYPAVNGPDGFGIINEWCGGFKAIAGTKKLRVHGGGHFASANNGIYEFDFAGTSAPTGWSIVGQSASPSNVIQHAEEYDDGKPTSIHSYDCLVYAHHNNCGYRFGGAIFGTASGSSNRAWKFAFDTGTWTSLGALPWGGTQVCSTIYDPVTHKILVLDGSTNGSAFNCYFFRCDDNGGAGSWSGAKAISEVPGNEAVSAWDPSRGRALVYGDQGARLLTVDFSTETVSIVTASAPALAVGRSFFYETATDRYWAFGGAGSSPWSTLWEINASTLATVNAHTLGATIPVINQWGSYGRFVFMPEDRLIGTVGSNTTAAYLIKLPSV